MGSSAMGASVLRKKIQAAGYGDVTVVNKAIANLSDDVRPRGHPPGPHRPGAPAHPVGGPRLGGQLHGQPEVRRDRRPAAHETNGERRRRRRRPRADGAADCDVLRRRRDRAGGHGHAPATTPSPRPGQLLVATGAVDASYVDAMHEREKSVSTHMGNGLAIPHGTNEAKSSIRRTAISFVRYADGIDWNGKPAEFVVGIAGAGDDHLALLSRIAEVFTDAAQVERLRSATSAADVRAVLDGVRV